MRASEFIENLAPSSTILYHATYRPLLKSIKAQGLGGSDAQAKWEDSQPGVVYLARDPEVARSYAETSDMVPEEWLDDIVILAIDASRLDSRKLRQDRNVQDDDSTLEYHGVIKDFTLTENFADGKKPGRKGLSRRVGIPKKATLGQLEKIAKSSTGERRRMAQWQLNMRRGQAKKK
jgi:hypothetical protein